MQPLPPSATTALDSQTLLWLEWSIMSISVLVSGFIVLRYSDLVPNCVHRIVKYGKSAGAKEDKKMRYLEIPKRYFFHFYTVALIFYLFLASLVLNIYFDINLFGGDKQIEKQQASFVKSSIEYLSGGDYFRSYLNRYQPAALVPPESVIIGLGLLIIQVTRRLCECTLISVYSNAQMNIIHYVFGHLFYIGVGLSMLAEAPGFTGQGSFSRPSKPIRQSGFLTPCHMIGIALFLSASFIQFDSHRILANLRKDKSGVVYTKKHSIPRGRWFDLVSSPHYMAEIIIYLALTIVLGGRSSTWWMVFLFVVTNQIIVGMFNHSWYQKTFAEYPKSRRAIIPFLL